MSAGELERLRDEIDRSTTASSRTLNERARARARHRHAQGGPGLSPRARGPGPAPHQGAQQGPALRRDGGAALPRDHVGLPRPRAADHGRVPGAEGHLQRERGDEALRPWRRRAADGLHRRGVSRGASRVAPTSASCRSRIPPRAPSGRSLDLMPQSPLKVCGEVLIRIHHHLMSKGAAETSTTMQARVLPRPVARAVPRVAQQQHAPGRARRRGEQRRSGAPRRRGAGLGRGRGRDGRRALRAHDPRVQHRGRAQQHHALPGPGRLRARPSGRDKTSLVLVGQEPRRRRLRDAHAFRHARSVDDQVRVAPVEGRALGILLLRRHRGPPRRPEASPRRSPRSAASPATSRCWARYPMAVR